jgi:heme/copper-type cytochrome/quinol oxidase subunit 1
MAACVPSLDCSEQVSIFNAILILAAMPALNASIVMLLFDRLLEAPSSMSPTVASRC